MTFSNEIIGSNEDNDMINNKFYIIALVLQPMLFGTFDHLEKVPNAQ